MSIPCPLCNKHKVEITPASKPAGFHRLNTAVEDYRNCVRQFFVVNRMARSA